MGYTTCPYCHKVAKDYGLISSKEIGFPLIMCQNCNQYFVDDNMYEWHAISKGSRLFYCLFSNYRISFHWFASIFPAAIIVNDFWIGFWLWAIIEIGVSWILYSTTTASNHYEIQKSKERVQDPQYIDMLAESGYAPLDLKLYNEYLDRKNEKYKNQKQEATESEKVSLDHIALPNPVIQKQEIASLCASSVLSPSNTKSKSERIHKEYSSNDIQVALNRWKQRSKSDWEIGIEYERYIGYLLEREGYKVQYVGATQGVNDMGRDLIATKCNNTLVIQCKRWSTSKTIHEKHIFQLHGSTAVLTAENPDRVYKSVFITTTELSEKARKCAGICNVSCIEHFAMSEYPLIKCNCNKDGEKIYHLPFDPQYDKIIITKNKKSFYAWTVKEAEDKGFRHTYQWSPQKH